MKIHTKIYMQYFNIGIQDVIYDELEFVENGRLIRANDIHHIEPKGMGGSAGKEHIENYIALNRENHASAHAGLIENLKEIHLNFMKNNPYY
jgi:hypothetical protein